MTKVCPIVIVEWSIPENGIGKTQVDQSKQVMEQVFEYMTNVPSVVKVEQSIFRCWYLVKMYKLDLLF